MIRRRLHPFRKMCPPRKNTPGGSAAGGIYAKPATAAALQGKEGGSRADDQGGGGGLWDDAEIPVLSLASVIVNVNVAVGVGIDEGRKLPPEFGGSESTREGVKAPRKSPVAE